ncbi:hypothetical protein CK203_032471 [Vitis vinifera]|uniref:Uncharacterized protein n=1 Tax=Vitis vinifera TaxID=29760 RepID=A0A438I6M6_VITVI|nr:hypothetical protein CK203_032471 [Vitis vinifera]
MNRWFSELPQVIWTGMVRICLKDITPIECEQAKWYYYVVLALVDVEANFLGEREQPSERDLLVIADLYSMLSAMLVRTWNVCGKFNSLQQMMGPDPFIFQEFLVKSADRVELMALLGLLVLLSVLSK